MLPSEITLHIGLQKTATTLVQRSLEKLRPQLASRGVAYLDRVAMAELPALRGWRAFRDPADQLSDLSPAMPTLITHQAELADVFTEQVRELALERCDYVVAQSGASPRHLLVSNESLVGAEAPDFGVVYRPRAEAALLHVLDALRPEKVNLILYIRRQDRLIESQYMQRILAGEVHEFADFARLATARKFIRFADLVERLGRLDRVANVRVRPFEIIGAGPRQFMADLLGPLDVEIDLAQVSEQRANSGYSAPALQAALALNGLIESREQLRATRRFLRKTFPPGEHPAPSLFDAVQRRAVLDMYDRSNRRFFEKYLPGVRRDAYSDDAATATLADLIR